MTMETWNVKHFACSSVYMGALLAHLLGVSRSTVARMVKDGRLPPRSFGTTITYADGSQRHYGGGWTGDALNDWMRETGRALVEHDGELRIITVGEDAEFVATEAAGGAA